MGTVRAAQGSCWLLEMCVHRPAHGTGIADHCGRDQKERLVWQSYLWSRNSATDTDCHPMMDQWDREKHGSRAEERV